MYYSNSLIKGGACNFILDNSRLEIGRTAFGYNENKAENGEKREITPRGKDLG